jgi:apolipoprotein N-acyltransferase
MVLQLYARVEWPWLVLGWVGLVPWLAALDRARSLRGALVAGALMCVAFVLAVFGWFAEAIQAYTGAPIAVALLVVLLLAPLLQPQFMTFALARHLAQRTRPASGKRNRSRPGRPSSGSGGNFWCTTLVGACAYVGSEWAIPKLFADTLGHGLYASVLMRQAADLAGAHGLTFALVVANESVLAVMRVVISDVPRRIRLRAALAPAGCIGVLVFGLLAYGAVRCRQFGGQGVAADRVTVGVVQADISRYGGLAAELGTFEAVRLILDTHFALSAEALRRASLDLIVWPETVYPTTFGTPKSEEGAAFDRGIAAFVNGAGVPLVFGAYDVDGQDEFNAAVLLEPAADGRLTFETYHKVWLFPLTERVPALLESAVLRRWWPWLGTWKPGSGPQVLALQLRDGRTLRIAPLICYDAVVPGHVLSAVRRGAELIVTLSNDSWFTYANVPRLILVISAFRSIETRRPQVRATNTGISAVIAPTGEIVTAADVHERAALVATVTPERHATTLMLQWGDWFGPSALAVGIALLALTLTNRSLTN